MNRSALSVGARLLPLAIAAALAGCNVTPFARTTVTTRGTATPQAGDPGAARAYACEDGSRIHLLTRRDGVTLDTGERTLRLGRRPADAGARYAADGVELHLVGERARLVSPQARHDCRDAGPAGPWMDAALRGVRIRAIGHEPAWSLEIVPGRWLHFRPMDKAGGVLALDPVRAVGTDGTRRYSARGDGRELRVRVREMPCSDSMSGERFALQVAVTVGERILRGCGRRL